MPVTYYARRKSLLDAFAKGNIRCRNLGETGAISCHGDFAPILRHIRSVRLLRRGAGLRFLGDRIMEAAYLTSSAFWGVAFTGRLFCFGRT